MGIRAYHLGCPMWANKDWVGTLFEPRTRPSEFLAAYARIFNTVEGNTTFYSTPSSQIVDRWKSQVPAGFRFCFKLPQQITHRRMLEGVDAETTTFLTTMSKLEDRLGPFLIQLPASFGPNRITHLERFLTRLPRELRFAVELRDRSFHLEGNAATRIDEVLASHRVDRVIMDTRAMRSGDPSHPDVAAVEHKKPDLPIRPVITAHHPVLRFVGYPELSANAPWIDEWRRRIGAWLHAGLVPYVFIHSPNNARAPELARAFHIAVAEAHEVGVMPRWPAPNAESVGQLRMF